MAGWGLLPSELLRRAGDYLLATHDIDCYVNMRAVCHNWRLATARPCRADPRFRPGRWVMLEEASKYGGDSRLFVNVSTGRFLRRRLPLLRDHALMAVSSDGLLFLEDKNYYSHASDCSRVLNPLTGSLLHFAAPLPRRTSRVIAAVTGSDDPTLVLAFHDDFRTYNHVGDTVCCAGPASELFMVEFSWPGPFFLASMLTYAGHIYMADAAGSIFKIVGTGRRCSGELIAEASSGEHVNGVFLVESAGELLLVRRLSRVMEVSRVDVERKVLEPVNGVGSRALFLGDRCLSVNADKLPSVDSNCIYYTTRQLRYYRYDLGDGREEKIPGAFVSHKEFLRVRPFSLVQVLLTYCVLVPDVPVQPNRSIQPGHRVYGISWEGEHDNMW